VRDGLGGGELPFDSCDAIVVVAHEEKLTPICRVYTTTCASQRACRCVACACSQAPGMRERLTRTRREPSAPRLRDAGGASSTAARAWARWARSQTRRWQREARCRA
jgi:hypothetical protein